jgi:hypothetical protein
VVALVFRQAVVVAADFQAEGAEVAAGMVFETKSPAFDLPRGYVFRHSLGWVSFRRCETSAGQPLWA